MILPARCHKQKQMSRVIWDPNPQLKNSELGRGQRLHMEG